MARPFTEADLLYDPDPPPGSFLEHADPASGLPHITETPASDSIDRSIRSNSPKTNAPARTTDTTTGGDSPHSGLLNTTPPETLIVSAQPGFEQPSSVQTLALQQPSNEALSTPYIIGCTFCRRPEAESAERFKVCARCRRTNPYMLYCSKRCQRDDWSRHRKICGIAVDYSNNRPIQMMTARITSPQWQIPNGPVERLYDIFVQHQDESLIYKLIIDSYRLLDEAIRDYNPSFFNLHTFFRWLDGYSFEGLQRFLDRTLGEEILDAVMPVWWTKDNRDECEQYARDAYHWSDIDTDVPREINDYHRYGGPSVRLPLRLAAAKIHGPVTSPEFFQTLNGLNALDCLALMGESTWL